MLKIFAYKRRWNFFQIREKSYYENPEKNLFGKNQIMKIISKIRKKVGIALADHS